MKTLKDEGLVRDIFANGGTIKQSAKPYVTESGEEKRRFQVRFRNEIGLWRTVVAFESSKFEDDAARREANLRYIDFEEGNDPVWVLCASGDFEDTDRFGSAEDED